MNIFVSDYNPIKAAQNLDDKRVRHMPKESFEMISMALYKNIGEAVAPFIIWNREHRADNKLKYQELLDNRCTNWVARSRENIWWLWCHSIALMDECEYRFNNQHYLYPSFIAISHYIPEAINSPKTFNDASGQYGGSSDIIENYKKCLNIKWFETDEVRPVIWTKRGKPNWANPILTFEQQNLFNTDSKGQMDLFSKDIDDDLPF